MNQTPQQPPPTLFSWIASVGKMIPFWVVICVAVLLLTLFYSLIFQGERVAFRDGAYFYPPLFEYIQSEWNAGRLPLWNPYENLGQPLAANPVSSVFYPGKLVYFLPIPAHWAYSLYILGHFVLASVTSYRLARHFGCSIFASGMAAVAYTFGGSVLFQYSNVVFLVGAAWLPAAIQSGDRCLKTRTMTPTICLGTILALMVLGGDPQSAYHALLLLFLWGIFLHAEEKKQVRDNHPMVRQWTSTGRFDFFTRRPVLLSMAVLVGMVLAAVQWLPAIDFGLQGDRMLEDKPVSLWSVPAALKRVKDGGETSWNDVRNGLLSYKTERSDGIAATRYRYSVSPWRLVEWIWPNASGKIFPINTRWGILTESDTQVWVPSLYMGVIPFLLAFVGLRFRKSDAMTLWLSWGLLFFVCGAFGLFGLGWIVNHLAPVLRYSPHASGVGDAVGGVYWLMNLILPGYDQFRYPAKLMTVASLLLAMLAARTFDQCFGLYSVTTNVSSADTNVNSTDFIFQQRRYRRKFLFYSQLLLVVSLILIPLVLVPEGWVQLQKKLPPNHIFGRFQVDRAIGEATFSLVHVVNCLLLLILAIRLYVRTKGANVERSGAVPPLEEQQLIHKRHFSRFGLFILVILCGDLVLSNRWMIATAPGHHFEGRPALISQMSITEKKDSAVEEKDSTPREKSPDLRVSGPHFPTRVWRAPMVSPGEPPWYPVEFADGSATRITEKVVWERATLWPKYPTEFQIASIDTRGSVMFGDYYAISLLIRNAWNNQENIEQKFDVSLHQLMQALGVSYMVTPTRHFDTDHEEKYLGHRLDRLNSSPKNAELFSIAEPSPRVFMETAPSIIAPVSYESRRSYFAQTSEIFAKVANQNATIVEFDGKSLGQLPFPFAKAFMSLDGNERRHDSKVVHPGTWQLLSYSPERLSLRAGLSKSSLLVLADQYDTNWKASVRLTTEEGKPMSKSVNVPIFRTNRVMRGIPLPAGTWEVTLYYDPMSFRIGMLFSMIGWLFLGFFFLRTLLVSRKIVTKKR